MNKRKATVKLMTSTVQAGFATWAEDQVERNLSLDDYLVEHPATTFLVRVSGESMLEAGIMPGDVLVVDRGQEAVSGQIVIAVVDNDLTVKRLVIKDRRVILKAENQNFPEVIIPEGAKVEIWGIVVGVIRKL
jgi:DNA polymerase V